MRESDVEPLRSRFSLSYNTVLNLVRGYADEEIARILRMNFASFQTGRLRDALTRRLRSLEESMEKGSPAAGRKGKKGGRKKMDKEMRRRQKEIASVRRQLKRLPPEDAHMQEFQAKKRLLEDLDYLRDGALTARGEFAAQINGKELLITEMYFAGLFHDLSIDELNAYVCVIDYEPRRAQGRPKRTAADLRPILRIADELHAVETAHLGYSDLEVHPDLAGPAMLWSRGSPFADVVREADVDEGDVVYAFRRGIDILRQVRHAVREDAALAAKLREAMDRMDRDEVSILL